MSLLAGFFLGVLGSVVAWSVVRGVKPRLQLSPEICLNPDDLYCLKIVNRGYRGALDLAVHCYAVRSSDDHRYPEMLDISTMPCKPSFEPLLHGRFSRARRHLGLSVGRIIRLGLGGSDVREFFDVYPHGALLVYATAVDSFSGSRVISYRLYSHASIRRGVFRREDLAIDGHASAPHASTQADT